MQGVILEEVEKRLKAANESVIQTLGKVKLKTKINDDLDGLISSLLKNYLHM